MSEERCNSKSIDTQCVMLLGHEEEKHHGWDPKGRLVEWDNRCSHVAGDGEEKP